ncbi:bleomycin resistance protein [Shewanella baltica]|uniref:bleomycin resistance protein n=1 Tax=Shewanella baltica TaxID=62322 RepID=UPI003D7BD8B3
MFLPLTPELNVRDIGKSLDFYIGQLGFTICYERPEEGFATIELDGAFLMLEQIDELEPNDDPWITAKLEYPFGRGINFQIIVIDLDGIYNRLLKNGYPIKLPLEQKSYRAGSKFINVRQFMVMDPDGYLLRLSTQTGVR